MSRIPESEFGPLFDSEELGKNVYFLELIGSWLNLRILDFLYINEEATTGEIARGINMDMREVRDGLKELERIGVIESKLHSHQETNHWIPATSEISISIRNQSGLYVDYSVAAQSESIEDSHVLDEDAFSLSNASSTVRSRLSQIISILRRL